MDNLYLQELIDEAKKRDGGLILNLDEKPAVVVLTIEKYNALINSPAQAEALPRQAEPEPGAGGLSSGQSRTILVTGGAGYIGAHVARRLLASGFDVIVVDNLSTGKRENVPPASRFYEGDLKDANFLRDIFSSHRIEAVMHLAASIEVEESVREPEKYFQNNALNTATLLSVMSEFGVRRMVFSSTCAVYEPQGGRPLSESSPVNPGSPYGHSKLLAENIIKYYASHLGLSAVVFRYFNACGCDFDGAIKPTHESHLLPNILQVANGEAPLIRINGTDYKTLDGTCVRDYVHVLDIARAHESAIEYLSGSAGFEIVNIGTGRGYSVLEMVKATAEVLNRMIPMEMGQRRPGDAELLVAETGKAKNLLGFEAKHSSLPVIIETAWKQYKQK